MQPTRRTFLATTATFLAASATAAEHEPIIDTHTHFYDPTRKEGVPWPGKDDKVLYRPVLPDEFKKLVRPHGVNGTVIVEASPWVADNDWLLALAKDDPFIRGIVGNLSITSDFDRDNEIPFAQRIKKYATQPKFCGIRLNANVLRVNDVKRVEDRKHENIDLLAMHFATLDLNGGPDMLPDVARLAERHPKLRIVVNHMANVKIAKEPPLAWVDGMKALAKHPNVWCKMSALVEGTGRRDGKAPTDLAFYQPTLDALWNALGENRLVYGSDWPVSDHFATYATVFTLVDTFLQKKGVAARAKVFGTNAVDAYQLKRR